MSTERFDRDRRDYSIEEWCSKRRISHKMLKEGTAPRTLKLRKRRLITHEADLLRQAQHEEVSAL